MSELEKKHQMRFNCLLEASKLKQNPNSNEEIKNKKITDLAEELFSFVTKE